MTTDASKPECIAQFWQRSSCRDSQYSQSDAVPELVEGRRQ